MSARGWMHDGGVGGGLGERSCPYLSATPLRMGQEGPPAQLGMKRGAES